MTMDAKAEREPEASMITSLEVEGDIRLDKIFSLRSFEPHDIELEIVILAAAMKATMKVPDGLDNRACILALHLVLV